MDSVTVSLDDVTNECNYLTAAKIYKMFVPDRGKRDCEDHDWT